MKSRILFLAMIIAFVSCSKDKDDDNNNNNNNTNPPATSFLKTGNEWSYEYTMTTEGIAMTGDITYQVMEDLGNGTYKVKQTTSAQGIPPNSVELFWTEDDAFGLEADMTDVKVGDTWTETDEGITYTTTVVSVSEDMTVPAGTFSCIKLKGTQSDDDSIINYFYYHKTYGMIYSDVTSKDEYEGEIIVVNMKMKLKSKNF
ncbi:MAG: hypothetical protein JXA03_15440 [Bacteroidales bacterium]|nr:hypothetical protein [Bacteroidales bacterium]